MLNIYNLRKYLEYGWGPELFTCDTYKTHTAFQQADGHLPSLSHQWGWPSGQPNQHYNRVKEALRPFQQADGHLFHGGGLGAVPPTL